ncbi:MAG: T9SS type A sorting domain-containing protein [Flavobacteriales bacterium]
MILRRSFLVGILFAPCLCLASFFAGPDQFICGTATTLGADPLGVGESGFWTVVQGNATFVNGSSPTSFVTELDFGENILRWMVVTPSGPTSDAVSIWCYDSAMPVANAGPDQVVAALPGTVTLSASPVTAPGMCFWTLVLGGGFISDPNDPNATVSELVPGLSAFQWNCDNGPCGSSEDVVQIEATEFIGIAEAQANGNVPYYDPIGHRLVFKQNSPSMSITLVDQQGRIVEQLTTPAGAGVWDLSTLPSGIYTARVRTGDGISVQRFAVGR